MNKVLLWACVTWCMATTLASADTIDFSTPLGLNKSTDPVCTDAGAAGLTCKDFNLEGNSYQATLTMLQGSSERSVLQDFLKKHNILGADAMAEGIANFQKGLVVIGVGGCASVLLVEGCSCSPSKSGQPIISCPAIGGLTPDLPHTPIWTLPDTQMYMKGN